jgi:hypothetical protein
LIAIALESIALAVELKGLSGKRSELIYFPVKKRAKEWLS